MDKKLFDIAVWNIVLNQIVRRTRDQAEAEDLLHSAYLKLQRYGACNKVDNPAAFLVRTAVNLKADNCRRERRLARYVSERMLTHLDGEPLQDEVISARERLERVLAGLDKLAPRTREIFLMQRIDGLKYREIAARIGISESAVEKHMTKAVMFLMEWTKGW